jgi:hypothetical protein
MIFRRVNLLYIVSRPSNAHLQIVQIVSTWITYLESNGFHAKEGENSRRRHYEYIAH